MVKTAQRIVGSPPPDLDLDVDAGHLQRKASSFATDLTHPGHTVIPALRKYRALKTKTNRLRNSFFPRPLASMHIHIHTSAPINWRTDCYTPPFASLHCGIHLATLSDASIYLLINVSIQTLFLNCFHIVFICYLFLHCCVSNKSRSTGRNFVVHRTTTIRSCNQREQLLVTD